MRLTDLQPRWVSYGGEGVSNADGSPIPERAQIGVMFECPCGCALPCFVSFKNPPDGGPRYDTRTGWHRDGDTFETLTLSPSILRSKEKGGCGWHGWIQNGEVRTC